MKCTIIQDLLPLYCDGLTSPDSNEEIEKHLTECEKCREVYDNMKAKEMNISIPERDVKPLKTVKKRNMASFPAERGPPVMPLIIHRVEISTKKTMIRFNRYAVRSFSIILFLCHFLFSEYPIPDFQAIKNRVRGDFFPCLCYNMRKERSARRMKL